MENNMLKINGNLKLGEYTFDNGSEVISMPIINEGENVSKTMTAMNNELRDEYGFTDEILSRSDVILYEKLVKYDEKHGTTYTIKYLNVLAKEIERKQGESGAEYEKRVADIRGTALKNAGIELDYTMATAKEMGDMPLFDKLKLLGMAKKQKENGATYSSESIYIDVNAEEAAMPVITGEVKDDSDISTMGDSAEDKILEKSDDTKKKKSGLIEKFLNLMMLDLDDDDDDDEPEVDDNVDKEGEEAEELVAIDTKEEDIPDKPVVPIEAVEDKTIESAVSVEPVKEETIEPAIPTETDNDKVEAEAKKAEKVVNVNKEKKDKVAERPVAKKKDVSRRQSIQASKKAMRESKKMKNLYKQKISNNVAKTTRTIQPQKSKAQKKAEYNAKHKVQSKPSTTVVRTAVVEIASKQDNVIEKAPQENRVHRYTRKLKDRADSIRNKIAMSKDRFRRCAAVAAVGAVAIIAGVIFIPKAIASISLGAENNSEITIQAYDITEKTLAKEFEDNETFLVKEMTQQDIGINASSYIRDAEVSTTENIKEEETLSKASTRTIANEVVEAETVEAEVVDDKVVEEAEENDLTSYLDSLTIGSTMTIDSGKYYECPDGSGKYGNFENHAGEDKILSKIGITTDEGYVSISSDDASVSELKLEYADDEFSYHFVDEEGHILGWVTDEEMDDIIEQQTDNEIDDEMDR